MAIAVMPLPPALQTSRSRPWGIDQDARGANFSLGEMLPMPLFGKPQHASNNMPTS